MQYRRVKQVTLKDIKQQLLERLLKLASEYELVAGKPIILHGQTPNGEYLQIRNVIQNEPIRAFVLQPVLPALFQNDISLTLPYNADTRTVVDLDEGQHFAHSQGDEKGVTEQLFLMILSLMQWTIVVPQRKSR